MAPVAPVGLGGGGNTNSSPQKEKQLKVAAKRVSASKKWCFTWNNYPDNWLALLAPGFEGARWRGCKEIGIFQSTPHIQGYIEFPVKVRPLGYKGLPKEMSWHKMKGDMTDNENYCTKDTEYLRVDSHLMNFQQVDLKLYGNIRPQRTLKFPPMDKPWQKDILREIEREPDDRTIWWYWSLAGKIGKTTFCKYLTHEHGAIPLSGKGADVRNGVCTHLKINGSTPDLCVFPIPRSHDSSYLSYEAIENIKDMYFYSGKYEGGAVCGPCPHLFVFANFKPDTSKMSADRWKIVNIDEIKEWYERDDY